jgi:Tfp pilus assembly protein PilW
MDCKITSIKTSRAAAFALAEMMVAVAVGILVVLAAGTLYQQTSQGFVMQYNYVDLDNQSHLAMDKISMQLRQSSGLSSMSATQIVVIDTDGNPLTFTYSNTNKTLTRIKGTTRNVLLEQCDSLTFATYQRNPVGGNGNFVVATDASTVKLVQIDWNCSRKIFGRAVNTEAMQSSKIMLRNKD